MNQMHFYKKTTAPDNYDYYDHSTGVVGFKKLQTEMGPCIFSGTIEEMEIHYGKLLKKRPRRGYKIY